MASLDAMFRIETVPAHVPFAHGAFVTGDRIGASDDRHGKLTRLEAGRIRSRDHARHRLVTDHEAMLSRRCGAIRASQQLAVRAADADGNCFEQHAAFGEVGFGPVLEPRGLGFSGTDGDRLHGLAVAGAGGPYLIAFLMQSRTTFAG